MHDQQILHYKYLGALPTLQQPSARTRVRSRHHVLIERVLVNEVLAAQGTPALATTFRVPPGASEAGCRVHRGAVLIERLL